MAKQKDVCIPMEEYESDQAELKKFRTDAAAAKQTEKDRDAADLKRYREAAAGKADPKGN